MNSRNDRKENEKVGLDVSKLVCDLCSYSSVENIVDLIPHKTYKDMVLVYKCILGDTNGSTLHTMTITNQMLDLIGWEEEKLHAIASANTNRLYPPLVKDIEQAVYDVLPLCYSKEVFANVSITSGLKKGEEMYFLMNGTTGLAASCITDVETMNHLAEFMEDDLVVLPMAKDNIAFIPYRNAIGPDMTVQDLTKIVRWKNDRMNQLENRLSNTVFVWKRTECRLDELTEDYTKKKMLESQLERKPVKKAKR